MMKVVTISGSEDYYNNNEDNNEDHIEVDAEQA